MIVYLFGIVQTNNYSLHLIKFIKFEETIISAYVLALHASFMHYMLK